MGGQPKKFEDEELKQLLEVNPTRTKTELAHALGVAQQAISQSLHRLGRIQKQTDGSSGTELICRPNNLVLTI